MFGFKPLHKKLAEELDHLQIQDAELAKRILDFDRRESNPNGYTKTFLVFQRKKVKERIKNVELVYEVVAPFYAGMKYFY